MKRNLLLIGPGYLGKEIQREFEDGGWLVTTASRSDDHLTVDLSDDRSVKALSKKLIIEERVPDCVIHCASASAGRGATPEVRLASYRDVYLKGCQNLSKIFNDAHLLFTSSTSVYGQQDGSLVTEETITEPAAATAKILVEAERAVLDAGGTVVRLSGIYGVGKSYLIKRLFAGGASMENGGERVLNHIHHHDGASACLLLLEGRYKGVFNVSETVNLTLKETYKALCAAFSIPMPTSNSAEASPRAGLNKRVSNQKMLDLGWEPKYPSFLDAMTDVAKSMKLI